MNAMTLALLAHLVVGAGEFDLRTANIDLDSAKWMHDVEINSAKGYITHIVLPDRFVQQAVSCAQCYLAAPGVDLKADGKRAWFVEVNEGSRKVTVRPLYRPGEGGRSLNSLRTNVVIDLDGGHHINLILNSMPSPQPGEVAPVVHTVVTLTLPDTQLFNGRLAEAIKKEREANELNIEERANELMLERLYGEVHCQQAWGEPTRNDRTVVRLKQMCSVEHPASKRKTFFLMFTVQNRQKGDLHLKEVELTPNKGKDTTGDTMSFRFEKTTLGLDDRTTGIALCSLEGESTPPASWRLRIVPGGRSPVEVNNIIF